LSNGGAKTRFMEKQLFVIDDYERDFLKDLIYLQEEIIDLNKEINERLEANIFIIDEDKILNDGKIRSNLLPF
jgi:hypothetical protein